MAAHDSKKIPQVRKSYEFSVYRRVETHTTRTTVDNL